VRAVRRAFGARFSGRAAADWIALLHQFGFAEV